MSRSIGDALPDGVLSLLDGERVARSEGLTLLLVSLAPDGWPHVAMLSAGEVLATGPREVRLALWPGTSTTANLESRGLGLLMVVADGTSYYARLAARRGTDLLVTAGRRAFFVATVEEVLQDSVGYAEITSGITFRLNEPEKVVPAWEEAVAAMRSAAAPG
jgi:hypothetical protein